MLSKQTNIHPRGNRCCKIHLIKHRFYEDDIAHLEPYANCSSIPRSDLCILLNSLTPITTLKGSTDHCGLSEKQLLTFTGLTVDAIYELKSLLKSLRNSSTRTSVQAIIVFLLKLKTGSSNEMIASILGLQHAQLVSEYFSSVLNSFETDVLPQHFGLQTVTRELIHSNTSQIAKGIFSVHDEQLMIICDGTYIRHQKSSNNMNQKNHILGRKKSLYVNHSQYAPLMVT